MIKKNTRKEKVREYQTNIVNTFITSEQALNSTDITSNIK